MHILRCLLSAVVVPALSALLLPHLQVEEAPQQDSPRDEEEGSQADEVALRDGAVAALSLQRLGRSAFQDFASEGVLFVDSKSLARAGYEWKFDNEDDPDLGRSTAELVVGNGYPLEQYNATTPDGYILGLFRIPHARNGSLELEHRPAVLLQHGLLDCSTSFVINKPEQSLAFILADAGWDVWLGNNRGNDYSRAHQSLDTHSADFWDFTFDEMAEYDLPTEINFVLKHTGALRLAYVGHSEGSMQAWAKLSQDQHLASKLSVLVAMAPVAFVKRQRVIFIDFLRDLGVIRLLNLLEPNLDMDAKLIRKLIPNVCEKGHLLRETGICTSLVDAVFGASKHLNSTRLPVYFSIAPSSTSTKNVAHFAQMTKTGRFAKYDYMSKAKNVMRYNRTRPPEYKLSDYNVPTALFSGTSDALADPADVQTLRKSLTPGVVISDVEIPNYSHIDFIWAQDANVLLYPRVLEVLKRFRP